MKIFNFLIIVLIFTSLASCSNKEEKISLIKEDNLEMQMIEAYNEGLKEFNRGDIFLLLKNLMRLNFYILNLHGLRDQL